MREEESNWFPRWDEELPSPEELMPLSQTLITPDLAMAFDIRNPNPSPTQNQSPIPNNPPNLAPPPPATAAAIPLQAPPSSSDFGDSADLNSAGNTAGDEPARTLKRPRLVWTPQLHKRFVDAVAHLGIKNAVPKTIMQLMSVDGLTRENVASHLQKYRLYLKRMQGLSSGGGGGSGGGVNSSDPATDHLFASSPVPAHFLHPAAATSARPGSEQHYLPFVPVTALHHHQQHHHQIAAIQGQFQHHRQQFEHPFLARPVHHRIALPAPTYGPAEDLDPVSAGGPRKVLTLFPTGED